VRAAVPNKNLAIAAAPYCHARLAEKTKKAADAEAADKAADEWSGDLEYLGGRPQ